MRKLRSNEERTRRFYDCLWQNYTPEYAASKKHWALFFDPEEVLNKSVLDAGCGTGVFSIIFARMGALSVVGIDISKRSLERAQRQADQLGLQNATFQKVNMLRLPFTDACFDIVWSWGSVHHTADPFGCLAELIRVLKPGGSLLVAVYRRTGLTFLHETLRKGLIRLPSKYWIPFSRFLSLVAAPGISLFKKRDKSRKGEKLEQLLFDWFFVPIRHSYLPEEIKSFLVKRGLVIKKYLPFSGRFNSTSNFIFKARKQTHLCQAPN
ncbi:MAG: class I SAM-dependent methyltransferase [Candidatus Aminicenantales bacterium]